MADFFHVDSRGELKAGDLIVTRPVTSKTHPDDAKELNAWFPSGLSYFGAARILHTNVNDPSAIIEQILETIRRTFKDTCGVDYPSRLSSLFALDTLDAALLFRSECQRRNATIWRVRCDEYFRGDMKWIGDNIVKDHNDAVYYWQRKPTIDPFWECVLKPPIQVMDAVE